MNFSFKNVLQLWCRWITCFYYNCIRDSKNVWRNFRNVSSRKEIRYWRNYELEQTAKATSGLEGSCFVAVHLSNSVQVGPSWEGNCLSAEKVLHVLWSPKFHYRVRKTVATIQSEMNPIHTSPHYFFTISSDVILPSTIFYIPCGLWCVRRRNCSVFCVLTSAQTADGLNTTRVLYVA